LLRVTIMSRQSLKCLTYRFTIVSAPASAESHYNWRTLCSPYANNGHQETYSAECRILTDLETGEQIILIPDGPWTTGFGYNRLPADTRYGDGFEYLGPLHARLDPARQFYVYP
jgi:hypothetical protein